MYSWTPKEGLDDSTKAMPRCTPARDINYTVITWSGDYATATCRDTAYMRVRVVEFPKVHATGASVVCPNSTVALHARIDSSAVSGLVPQWELESGTIVGRGDSIAVE